jgi:hypothetical protein
MVYRTKFVLAIGSPFTHKWESFTSLLGTDVIERLAFVLFYGFEMAGR